MKQGMAASPTRRGPKFVRKEQEMNSIRLEALFTRKMSRRRLMITAGSAGFALTAAGLGAVRTGETAGAITTLYTSRFTGLKPPSPTFSVFQSIQDFPPGAGFEPVGQVGDVDGDLVAQPEVVEARVEVPKAVPAQAGEAEEDR